MNNPRVFLLQSFIFIFHGSTPARENTLGYLINLLGVLTNLFKNQKMRYPGVPKDVKPINTPGIPEYVGQTLSKNGDTFEFYCAHLCMTLQMVD
jgi:hypothetical protein